MDWEFLGTTLIFRASLVVFEKSWSRMLPFSMAIDSSFFCLSEPDRMRPSSVVSCAFSCWINPNLKGCCLMSVLESKAQTAISSLNPRQRPSH